MRLCHSSRGMLRFLASIAILTALPAVSVRAQQPSPAPSDSIRVTVDRVDVGVIVTYPTGGFAQGLQREDFHIFDGGVEQPITDFAAVTEPAQVLLVVEAGPSVYFLEASHLQAARALLDGLSTDDRVAVVKYDAAPQGLLDFTSDKSSAAAALENIRYYVGFGSLNLSKSLSTVLDWLAKMQGKKNVVLLSTGFDTSSPNDLQATLARLKTSDVRVLAISLSGGLRNPAPNLKTKNKAAPPKPTMTELGFAEADHLLTVLTESTGGRVYFPNSAHDFAAAYAQIAQLVRHEYSLAFAPPQHDGKIHAIEVRVSPLPAATPDGPAPVPAYRIDYRRAYSAPAP
jgi:Ca-activated chloride channel family protein